MKIFLMETAGGQKIALFREIEIPKKDITASGAARCECADSAHSKEKKKWRLPWQKGER